MPTLVGVRFSPLERVQYFDSDKLDLAVGDRVVVETDEGPQEAVVVIAPDQVIYSDLRGPLSPVLRKAEL